MAKAIDVGTSTIICAETDKEGNIKFTKQRDAFFSLERNEITEGILNNLKVDFIEKGDKIHVIGDNALSFASMFNTSARRPLNNGVLSKRDEDAFDMLKEVIGGVLGEPHCKGEVLAFTIPANPIDKDFDIEFHKGILISIFSSMGYSPFPVNEGNCVVYSELVDERLTGIGMSFGAGMVNVCISMLGISDENLSFSVAKGGDYIDSRVAETNIKLTDSKVTLLKEKDVDILNPKDHTTKAISIYYASMLEYVLKNMALKLSSGSIPDFEKPVTIVIAGGSSKITGFLELFKNTLEKVDMPIEIGNIKLASNDPLYTVATGAFNAALLKEKRQGNDKADDSKTKSG